MNSLFVNLGLVFNEFITAMSKLLKFFTIVLYFILLIILGSEERNVIFFVKIADKKKAIKEIKKEVKGLKIQVKESKDDKTRK